MGKQVVQVKLVPTPEQARALEQTLRAVNEAANWASGVAYRHGVPREYALRQHTYTHLKDRGLGSQIAQLVIKKTCHAYTTIAGLIAAGRLQGRRAAKARAKPIAFRPDAAQAFDDRCLSWQHDTRTISIWTIRGRMRGIAFTGHVDHLKTLERHRQGESDLMFRDGHWYLLATVDIPDGEPNTAPADFLGVDMGIVNIATTSDGDNHCGTGLRRYRKRMAKVRAELQAKATKSAKKKLKARARREARAVKDVNHRIAKQLVGKAERTGRGIALEDLKGIRDRVRLPAAQRGELNAWSFHQLQAFITYKARRAGVPVVVIDAHNTSRRCPRCGHTTKANRPTRDYFACRGCGLAGPADRVAAVNIRDRARMTWAVVNQPIVADTPQSSGGHERQALGLNPG
ncbi:RNA-guided endonuclease InsQ/TnpB family protein [Glycomyces tenuis]|uniref:RNA-guided endonuclease InsQ/TnpB family protein n=1 Tax=Glycomyces tenuis TaxID=58116 RepID=UPI00042730DC|nr:RNA-guided endonuclease TnpB family protein [Glycomyces tenuis]